ncbi:MAG: hypothetical protein STSR0008_18450 [Ignavibacterium sp.]
MNRINPSCAGGTGRSIRKNHKIYRGKMKKLLLLITMMSLAINCDDNPVDGKQENRSPVILSLSVFPDAIGPSDSAIVICNAMDPDGDTLVYDRITDGRLKIKDGQVDGHVLYNTFENARIVYAKKINNSPSIDTVWVQCFARDRKGKSDAQIIIFKVIKDSL